MQAMKKTNATKLKCKDTKLKEKDAYYETLPHHLVSTVINYSRIDNDMKFNIQHHQNLQRSRLKASMLMFQIAQCSSSCLCLNSSSSSI
jgi:hypothetical protein